MLSDETVSDVTTEARTQARAAGLAWIARRKARGAQRRLAHLRADGQSSDLEEMATGEGEEEEEEGGEDGALRCMVRSLFLPSLLPRVLDDVGHWTLRVRHRAVLLLADLISLGGPDQITAALPLVVRTLISTLVADGAEAEVDAAVEQAGRALGRTVPPGTLLEELLPQVERFPPSPHTNRTETSKQAIKQTKNRYAASVAPRSSTGRQPCASFTPSCKSSWRPRRPPA